MRMLLLPLLAGLAGCSQVDQIERPAPEAAPAVSAPPPPSNARTVEEFDTTSEAERARLEGELRQARLEVADLEAVRADLRALEARLG